MNRVMQSLWVGSDLTTMERLSIASFLKNGHEFRLFTYQELNNVPQGTTVLDAREILPAASIFRYRDRRTYSGFANFFRYKLLLERGGWWVDVDTVCLRPFDFPEPYVFSTERHLAGDVVNNGILKAPAGSALMSHVWSVCQSKDPARIVHGETGPKLMGEAVRELGLDRYARSHDTFCPLPGPEWFKVLEADREWQLGPSTHAIHLWNELWRQAGQGKDGTYPPNCLYERLKQRYLRQSAS